jgi:CheY-like chemotaxis protein
MPQTEPARAHILVVDDAPAILRMLQILLTSDGYSVATASSGSEALQRAADRCPDLVILDLLMPRMDGWEVLERMRAQRMDAPTVVLTADRRSQHEAETHQVAACLMKPFDVDELLRLVARLTGEA